MKTHIRAGADPAS